MKMFLIAAAYLKITNFFLNPRNQKEVFFLFIDFLETFYFYLEKIYHETFEIPRLTMGKKNSQ